MGNHKKIFPIFRSKKRKHQCNFPTCEVTEGLSEHHILPRSLYPLLVNTEWNKIKLCSRHHVFGKSSVHLSQKWLKFYKKFLPVNWKELYEEIKKKKL